MEQQKWCNVFNKQCSADESNMLHLLVIINHVLWIDVRDCRLLTVKYPHILNGGCWLSAINHPGSSCETVKQLIWSAWYQNTLLAVSWRRSTQTSDIVATSCLIGGARGYQEMFTAELEVNERNPYFWYTKTNYTIQNELGYWDICAPISWYPWLILCSVCLLSVSLWVQQL